MVTTVPVIADLPTGLIDRFRNGAFLFNPEGSQASSDGSTVFVVYRALTQSGTVLTEQLTTPGSNQSRCIRMTQTSATAKRMGLVQTVLATSCQDLRGSPINASHKARFSADSRTMFAVLSWAGSADAAPADPINDWTSTAYIPGQFFVSTVTVLNYGYLSADAGVWTQAPYIPYQVGTSVNNLIYVVWTEEAVAQNTTLDLGLWQLAAGSEPQAFEYRPLAIEEITTETPGTAFYEDIGISGPTIPFCNAPVVWGNANIYLVPPVFVDRPGSLGALGLGLGLSVAGGNVWDNLQVFSDGIQVFGDLNFQSNSAGGLGPVFRLFHNSASPAAADIPGIFAVQGKNSAASTVTYTDIRTVIDDPNAGSEDSSVVIFNYIAGVNAAQLYIGNGLLGAGATGGYRGSGSANMVAYFVNGDQVVGARGGAIADVPTGGAATAANNATAINAILAFLRAWGAITT